jgi:NTF2 fold immunity protein of polymorphic toxin system component
MKVHKIAIVLMLLFVLLNAWATNQQKPMDEWEALQISLKGARSIHPKNGFVPNESTAIQIAEAAAKAQYGGETVSSEEPFHARLYGETWIVKGTLHPQGALGGTVVVKVSKLDGRIVFMIHQY